MATLYRRSGSPYWFVRFQLDGKVHRESTKQTKKSKAEEYLQGAMAKAKGTVTVDALMDELQNKLATLPQQKQDQKRQELAARLLQGLNAKLELVKAWDTWLANPRKKNPGQATLTSYQGIWDRFAVWMKEHHPAVTHLHEISPKMTEDYVTELWGSKITPSTYNAHFSFLKSCFNVLKTSAGLTLNPWADISRMAKTQESRRALTTEELRALCMKAQGSLRYMIAIGIYTGLRLGDVTTLKWSEVDLGKRIIDRVPMKTRHKNKSVRFPIHPVLAAMLEELKETSGQGAYLFPEEAKAYAADRSSISKLMNKQLDDCGITTTEKSGDTHRTRSIARTGFHSLRHSFVSLCAASNVPQVAIMEMVGHGSPAMTRLYSHAGDEQKANAIMALPDVSIEAPDSKKGEKNKSRKMQRKKTS